MFKIAIDGPAGAGKSTISKLVAKALDFEYIDTGAMYRAITLKAMRLGINMEDEEAYYFLDDTILDIDNGKIFMDHDDVSEEIRSIEITNNVSTPSKIKVVRDFLVAYQRKISEAKNVVMDGRDIGTVVFPNANLKIYLDATAECRAKRRQLEREQVGIYQSLEETIEEINARDFKDSTRAISPLKKADDAIIIDSSNMSIDEVVNKIIFLVYERGFKMSKAKYYEGQKVQGLIINVTKDAIYVEINEEEGVVAILYANDLDGYVEGQKLRDSYNEGQEFEAYVKQVTKDKKTGEPLYILSTKLESKRDELKAFEEIKERDEIISAKVIRVTRAGADLLYKNTKLFLPIRNIDISEEALNKLKGENIDVIVIAVNMDRLQVIVSNSIAVKKQHRLAKEAAYASLEVGQVHEGTVVSMLPYGAIVSIGEVSGLLHQSELDHKMVRNINDRLHVDDKVTVKIIGIEGNRIALSIKALTPHPWEVVKEQYHVGDVFEGVVSKIIPAGLLIKLTDQFSGLMPRSEYSWTFVEKLEDKVAEGDTLLVKVINIDDEKRRVSLSHKQTEDNAWGEVNLRKGDNIKVVVASIEEKGAKVNYLRVQGFLPIHEVTSTRRIGKVDEFFPVGTEIDVVVIDCNPSRAKLVVSSKALENAKERESYDKYVAQQERETPTSTIGDFLQQQSEEKAPRKKGRK